MKTNYTNQNELGLFGYHWGCYFTCVINIFEHHMGRKLRRNELYCILGFILLQPNPSVKLCNYKNHDLNYVDEGLWDEKCNPEWHFYVNDLEDLIYIIAYVLDIRYKQIDPDYKILKWSNGYSTHFTLKLPSGDIINPADWFMNELWEVMETRHLGMVFA